MEVPFRLARRDEPARVDALLILADGFERVVDAVVRTGAAPDVFAVRGGFLLVPRDGNAAVPGTIRLRRLAGDLFVPADADLVPALLPDESAALTRDRGLIFLPSGPVLAFDPAAPLPVGRWVAPAAVRRAEWKPLPAPPERADRLTVIERPSPPAAVIEVLNAGRPDDAEPLPGSGEAAGSGVPEDARPPAGSAAARAAAAATMGAAVFLAWLGKMAGLSGLAKAGANLARKAIDKVPRVSEKLFGEQEAALREVLRQLQEGDVEKALRRAPPAFADPDAPARVGTDANLGTRDPRYDLRSLIGGGGGAATAWLGGGDVWGKLAEEYRRLAREATARGDFRRAAYLHGVLLRDPRAAANTLLAGGLFRDAALLFRDKLHDDLSAAAAFDQAGDYDEAVRLYDRTARYEAAGDLLRRIGDEERARGYFVRAADVLAGRREWVAAGDLIRRKAGDLAAAGRYYRRGWDEDGAESVACGERLLDEMLTAADLAGAGRLFDAAEARYAPPRATEAGRFFHYAREVGELFLPPDRRDDLADRTRLLFARHLRENGPGGVGGLFSKPGAWPAPVVRDATFASRTRPRVKAHGPPLRLVDGPVYGVVVAADSGEIVVAAAGGVVAWAGDGTAVRHLAPRIGGEVHGLSVALDGKAVFLLRSAGARAYVECFYGPVGGQYRRSADLTAERPEWAADVDGGWYLEPAAWQYGLNSGLCVASPRERFQLAGQSLLSVPMSRFLGKGGITYLLVRDGSDRAWDWDERFLRLLDANRPPVPLCRWLPHWAPGVPPGSTLTVPRTDWLTPARGVLEVAGVDRNGVAHWFHFDGRDPKNTAARTASAAGRFNAACLIAPGQVAAVADGNVVHWYYPDGTTLRTKAVVPLRVPARAVALVARGTAGDLVAVLADGTAVRVSPGGAA